MRARLRRLLGRAGVGGRRPLRYALLGLADQSLIAATSFVTLVLVARAAGPSGFGAFVLVYALLQYGASLQTALITQPHNVLAPRDPAAYVRYTSATARRQALLAGGAAAALAAAGGALAAAGSGAAPLVAAAAPALLAWQALEYVRRVLYTEGRLGAAVAVDGLAYGGQAAAVLALAAAGSLSGPAALLAMAAALGAGAAAGAWATRASFRRGARADLGEHWAFARWLAGATSAYWLSAQIYPLLAAVVLGTEATGLMKAAFVLLGPLNVILILLDTLLPIAFARGLEAGGRAVLDARLRLAYLATAPAIGLYCLVVVLVGDRALRAVFGAEFAGQTALLALAALYYGVSYATRILSAALRARRRSAAVFAAYAGASAVGLTLGWPALALGGIEAGVGTMVAGAAVAWLVLLRAYRAERERPAVLVPVGGLADA